MHDAEARHSVRHQSQIVRRQDDAAFETHYLDVFNMIRLRAHQGERRLIEQHHWRSMYERHARARVRGER